MKNFIVVLLLLAGGTTAYAQHPPEHMLLHEKFYSTWLRPDNREYTCCGNQDCYPTKARLLPSGNWEYWSRLLQKWASVPMDRVEQDRDSPDGNSHVCALESPASEGGMTEEGEMPPMAAHETVLCFVHGGAT